MALVRQGAAVATRFNAVAWELLDVLRAGATAESELATLWDQVEEARYRDQQQIAQRFADEGVLREGLSVDAAAALFWALTAHDQYRLLVIERHWEQMAFEDWLAAALCRELLQVSGGGPPCGDWCGRT